MPVLQDFPSASLSLLISMIKGKDAWTHGSGASAVVDVVSYVVGNFFTSNDYREEDPTTDTSDGSGMPVIASATFKGVDIIDLDSEASKEPYVNLINPLFEGDDLEEVKKADLLKSLEAVQETLASEEKQSEKDELQVKAAGFASVALITLLKHLVPMLLTYAAEKLINGSKK